jgi:hypothetical protein
LATPTLTNQRIENMKLASSLLFALLSVATAGAAAHQAPPVVLCQQDVIRGDGEKIAAAKDVSKSQNFHVYVFKKDGITYVQINRLNGSVLTAVALAGSASFILPVGELSASQVVIAKGAAVTQTVSGSCPCSGQVVYSGPDGKVIVVYGSDGKVIQVVVLPPAPK